MLRRGFLKAATAAIFTVSMFVKSGETSSFADKLRLRWPVSEKTLVRKPWLHIAGGRAARFNAFYDAEAL